MRVKRNVNDDEFKKIMIDLDNAKVIIGNAQREALKLNNALDKLACVLANCSNENSDCLINCPFGGLCGCTIECKRAEKWKEWALNDVA